MAKRDTKLILECKRRIASGEGVNYAQARSCFGPKVADDIFHELAKHDEQLAYITEREQQRLVEWRGKDHKKKLGIIRNIVEGTLAVDDA